MGAENSFKKLGKEEEEKFPHPPPETEMGVMGNVRVFSFMSNILELYLPRVVDMFVSIIGGSPEKEEEKKPPTGHSREDSDQHPDGTLK